MKYASKSLTQIASSILILPTVIVDCVKVVEPLADQPQASVWKFASVSINGICTADLAPGITIPESLIICCVFASNTALVNNGFTSCLVYAVNPDKFNDILLFLFYYEKSIS